MLPAGTFARVWLARPAHPRPEDRNKVFALKVLKKIDGMRGTATP
jgi:protein kinase A